MTIKVQDHSHKYAAPLQLQVILPYNTIPKPMARRSWPLDLKKKEELVKG